MKQSAGFITTLTYWLSKCEMVHVRPHSRGTENKQLNLSMKLAKALDKHLDLWRLWNTSEVSIQSK